MLRLIILGLIGAGIGSCRTIEAGSDLDLTNSLHDTEGLFKPMFRIGAPIPGQSNQLTTCTATAVSPNTAITAGHCVVHNGILLTDVKIIEGEDHYLDLAVKANGVLVPDDYVSTNSYVTNDVAVLVFEAQPFDSYASLAPEYPKVGDRVTLIGFGKKDHTIDGSDGGRHYGVNDIASITSNEVRDNLNFYGHPRFVGQKEDGTPVYVDFQATEQHTEAGKNSGISQGDSGGPMLAGGYIVGVASTADAELTPEGMVHGHYQNLFGNRTQTFLLATKDQGAHISGLHDEQRRKVVTPRDLEEAAFDDSGIETNENYRGSQEQIPLEIKCVCQLTVDSCLLSANYSNGKALELANDDPSSCEDCEESFTQYKGSCKTIDKVP